MESRSRTTASSPLPRFRRITDASSVMVQQRDVMLLEDLWKFRCLTTSQLQLLRESDMDSSLRFVSRLTLTRRLKLLFHGGYVRRLARPCSSGSREPVYLLDKEGARVLTCRHGEVAVSPPSRLPSLTALDHLLAINQVHISLLAACSNMAKASVQQESVPLPAQLVEWQDSETARFTASLVTTSRKETTIRKVTLLPDGFFVLKMPKATLFYFLEVDRGTEISRIIAEKCRAYYAHWKEGGFGEKRQIPGNVGFRVLLIAPSIKRAASMANAINKLPAGRAMFWLTEEENILAERILSPVWRSVTQESACHSLLGQVVDPNK